MPCTHFLTLNSCKWCSSVWAALREDNDNWSKKLKWTIVYLLLFHLPESTCISSQTFCGRLISEPLIFTAHSPLEYFLHFPLFCPACLLLYVYIWLPWRQSDRQAVALNAFSLFVAWCIKSKWNHEYDFCLVCSTQLDCACSKVCFCAWSGFVFGEGEKCTSNLLTHQAQLNREAEETYKWAQSYIYIQSLYP